MRTRKEKTAEEESKEEREETERKESVQWKRRLETENSDEENKQMREEYGRRRKDKGGEGWRKRWRKRKAGKRRKISIEEKGIQERERKRLQ